MDVDENNENYMLKVSNFNKHYCLNESFSTQVLQLNNLIIVGTKRGYFHLMP